MPGDPDIIRGIERVTGETYRDGTWHPPGGMTMAEITITLHPFDDPETAAAVADAIRQRGEISYVDNSQETVKVSVGDVSVSVSG